jgi:hypothetical protein
LCRSGETLDYIVRDHYVVKRDVDLLVMEWNRVLIPVVIFTIVIVPSNFYYGLLNGDTIDLTKLVNAIGMFAFFLFVLSWSARITSEGSKLLQTLIEFRCRFPYNKDDPQLLGIRNDIDSLIAVLERMPINVSLVGVPITFEVVKTVAFAVLSIVGSIVQRRFKDMFGGDDQ